MNDDCCIEMHEAFRAHVVWRPNDSKQIFIFNEEWGTQKELRYCPWCKQRLG